jgi:hypothetical protein
MPERELGIGATFLVLLAFGVVLGILGWVAGRVVPAKPEDPRLGAAMFWIWVCGVASLTYVLDPALSRGNRRVELAIWGIGALGWVGWKLGILREWEDSARDREEMWATTVGVVLGLIVRDLVR